MNWSNALGAAESIWVVWMGSMSWQVAVLVAVLFGVMPLLRKAPASLRCGLWMLVFVKLMLHPALSTPWSPGNLAPELPIRLELTSAEWPLLSAVSPENTRSTAIHDGQSVEPYTAPEHNSPAPVVPHGVSFALMSIWGIGAALLMLVVAGQTIAYSRSLMRHLEPAPDRMVRVFREQQAALKTSGGVLFLCGAISTPGVFGAWRPKILLPLEWAESSDDRALACVLAHELAHVKRFDLFVSWTATLLTCLYWFHPAVWLANLKMRREREMACDDAALIATGREGREYAGTILRVAEGFTGRVPAGVGLLGLLEMSDNLLQRIRSAGEPDRARIATWRSGAVLAMLVLLLPMGVWHGFAAAESPAPAVVAAKVSSAAPPGPAVPAAAPVSTSAASGVAFLEIASVGGGAELADASSKLYELITERLLNASGITLVERGKLDKAAKEIALDASGLVRADTAAELGKLVGARTIVTAKLMRIEPQWMLTARLIDSQTSELASVRAVSSESDGLPKLAVLASDRIAEKLATFGGRAASSPDPQQAAIAALREILAGKELPRVVVCIPESHIGTWVPDPAGENEVTNVLAQAGFAVIDVTTFMKRESSSWWLNIFHGPAQGREGTQIDVGQGFRSASDILHDTRLDRMKEKADLFIVGEAFSEHAGDQYGFKSCRARIEIKVIDTMTEQIAASLSQHATAADTAELIAGKTALRNAGTLLGVDLAKQLAAYWDTAKGKRKAAS